MCLRARQHSVDDLSVQQTFTSIHLAANSQTIGKLDFPSTQREAFAINITVCCRSHSVRLELLKRCDLSRCPLTFTYQTDSTRISFIYRYIGITSEHVTKLINEPFVIKLVALKMHFLIKTFGLFWSVENCLDFHVVFFVWFNQKCFSIFLIFLFSSVLRLCFCYRDIV